MTSALEDVYRTLAESIPQERIKRGAPMSAYTTFRIGGPADVLVSIAHEREILDVLSLCGARRVPFLIIGGGSNLLVRDKGIRGVVVHMGEHFRSVRIEEEPALVRAQSGAPLAYVANASLQAGLEGLEFASGIPGSVGGAVSMNAGAYGGQISDVLVAVRALMPDLTVRELTSAQLEFGYRHCGLVSAQGGVVLEASFALKPCRDGAARARAQQFLQSRRDKQPLNLPSAGSFFKRPLGGYASQLIEQSGCKGLCVGEAQVSEKHAGFFVNRGGATAEQMLELARRVQDRVLDFSGIRLEMEVRVVGE